jgi:LPXTG-motif cell wall-anchored protein
VTWEGNFHPSMSSSMKGIGTGRASSNTSSVLVPADMPVGTDLCVRDVLFGDGNTKTETSNTICFTSAAAATVETTTTTTTMAPSTTTTTQAPAVTEQEPTGQPAGNPATPGEMVQGQVISQPAPLAELPRTGTESRALVMFGGITMGLGILAVILGRRRTVRA